jgi:hypothetical protein
MSSMIKFARRVAFTQKTQTAVFHKTIQLQQQQRLFSVSTPSLKDLTTQHQPPQNVEYSDNDAAWLKYYQDYYNSLPHNYEDEGEGGLDDWQYLDENQRDLLMNENEPRNVYSKQG